MARQRIETVTSFARPGSALSDEETVSRVVKSAEESAVVSLAVLADALKDLEQSFEYLEKIVQQWPNGDSWSSLVNGLLEAVSEDLALRRTLQEQFGCCTKFTDLQPMLILVSELDDYVACRCHTLSAIPELAGLAMSHEILKKLVKAKVP